MGLSPHSLVACSTCDNLSHKIMMHVIKVVHLKELPSYNDFFTQFLIPNQLCVLSEAATRQWRSRQEWVCQDGSPNFDFLLRKFGDAAVPVANCKSMEFSAHAKQEMKMGKFLAYWQQNREAGHPPENSSLYLKDWHFTRDFPDYQAYSTCAFFQSDWMNEFWDVRKDLDDDYRFVYMGPKNTWTPFHADVFRSFSWSANICGRKRWIFFPPGEEDYLKDVHNNLVYDVTSKELEDPGKFPQAHRVQHRLEVIQHPGETIFVPSGWHHQVENLEDTISINHNWLNGCNVHQCWAHLKASLGDIEREISDCRDMEGWREQCQTILRALTGLDYTEFFRFMASIAGRRIKALATWQQKARNSTPSCNITHKSHPQGESQHSEPVPLESVALASEHSETLPPEPCLVTKDSLTTAEPPQHEGNSLNLAVVVGLNDAVHRSHLEERSQHSESVPLKSMTLESVHSEPCLVSKDAAELSQHEGNVFNLAEGADLNGEDQSPRHWSLCNVNHALFDLTSVALVLKDMRQHHTVILETEAEENNDTSSCGQQSHLSVSEVQREMHFLHLKSTENGSQSSECTKESCCIKLMLKEISQCLSEFGVEGDWESI